MSLVTFIVDVLERPRRRGARTPERTLLRAVAAQRAGGDADPLAGLRLVPHLVLAARRGVGGQPLTQRETADLLGLDLELVARIEREHAGRA
jgi:hypothetical protein